MSPHILKNWESQLKVKPTYQIADHRKRRVRRHQRACRYPAGPGRRHGQNGAATIGKIKLSGITDKGNGLFEVATAQYSDTKIDMGSTEASFIVTMPQSSAEYWYVKALGDNPTPDDFMRANMNVAKKMSSGAITLDGGRADLHGRQL